MSAAAIAALIDAIGRDSFANRFLALAGQAVVHDAAALMRFADGAPPEVLADRLKPSERAAMYGDYLKGVYLLSPFYRASLGLKAPRVARVKDVAPDGFSASEYHRRYFSQIGVSDMLGLLLPEEHGTLFLSLSRATGEPRFSMADAGALTALVPVFASAAQRHESLAGPLHAVMPQPKPVPRQASQLTAREAEVVNLMLEGHSAKALAGRLKISVETVRVHRKHIYAKLAVSSQAELFHWFLSSRA